MQTVVKKLPTRRGILSTLCGPRRTQTLSLERLFQMQSELWNINNGIGFSNCIPSVTNTPTTKNTAVYGQFRVGSPFIQIP